MSGKPDVHVLTSVKMFGITTIFTSLKKERLKMKRLLCILAALAMFVCPASSAYAVEEGDVVYPQAGDSQAAPRNTTPDNCIFVSCPFRS